jgi:hypothetical protein
MARSHCARKASVGEGFLMVAWTVAWAVVVTDTVHLAHCRAVRTASERRLTPRC